MVKPATPWPPGCRQLDQEEAAQIIRDGTHASAFEHGQHPGFDAQLIAALEAGEGVFALRVDDNRLMWQHTAEYMLSTGHALVNHVWMKVDAL